LTVVKSVLAQNSGMQKDHPNLGIALFTAAIILGIAMGTRNAFSGLWLQPMSEAKGWGREVFSFTVALQNLVWGASQPFIGLLTDKRGARVVLLTGAALYAAGLVGCAYVTTPFMLAMFGGVVMGLAISCSTYTVAYSVLGKLVSPQRRSWAFGIAAAAGSFGQFLMIPAGQWFITHAGWSTALVWTAAVAFTIAPLGLALSSYAPGKNDKTAPQVTGQTSVKLALKEAFADRSYALLTAGYFVCGFQVVFIGAHLTPYLKDHAIAAHVGVTALALIGLFNVLGTYMAGSLGQKYPKRKILSAIYFARSIVIGLFLLAPLTPISVYFFAAGIGFLWLSTVPPTNAIVAQVYGVRYLGLLAGIIFFSHQVGSFLGAWLGGRLFDVTGSYNIMWGICMALGVFAALVHWPIDERPLSERTVGVAA
jgi:MFS family permease